MARLHRSLKSAREESEESEGKEEESKEEESKEEEKNEKGEKKNSDKKNSDKKDEDKKEDDKKVGYCVNLDPATKHVPFGASIDIRDTVDYKVRVPPPENNLSASGYDLRPTGSDETAQPGTKRSHNDLPEPVRHEI